MSTAKLPLNVGIKMVELLYDFNGVYVLFHEFYMIWFFNYLEEILL
jgi:hypothetical protein